MTVLAAVDMVTNRKSELAQRGISDLWRQVKVGFFQQTFGGGGGGVVEQESR